MAQPYDVCSKWLIQHHAAAILRLAGVGGVRSWAPLPGELTQSRQLPDGLVRVRLDGHPDPVLFLVEIYTYPDNRVPAEALDDVLLTYLDRREVPELVTLVLAPKGRLAVADRLAVASRLGGAELSARWRVVNLWEVSAADLLPLADPGLAPWVPLLRIDGPAEPVLQQVRDAIDRTSGAERANLLGVTQILAGLRYDEVLLERLFGGEVSDMIESPILAAAYAKREQRAKQAQVLDILRDRFGDVPDDVAAAVKLVTGDVPLRALTVAAVASPTLADFRAAVPG